MRIGAGSEVLLASEWQTLKLQKLMQQGKDADFFLSLAWILWVRRCNATRNSYKRATGGSRFTPARSVQQRSRAPDKQQNIRSGSCKREVLRTAWTPLSNLTWL